MDNPREWVFLYPIVGRSYPNGRPHRRKPSNAKVALQNRLNPNTRVLLRSQNPDDVLCVVGWALQWVALKDVKGSYLVEYAQKRACLSIPHQVEMETQDHHAPNAPNPKPIPASSMYGRPRYSRFHHTLDCHLGSKPHVVDFFDKVVPRIADGCWEYMFGPQYVHMLGKLLSHLLWTLYMQFSRLIATLDVEAVPYERLGSAAHLSIPFSFVSCRWDNISECGWFLCVGCSHVVTSIS